MPHAPIRGILFDKDGTLFDFQATWGAFVDSILDRLAPDRAAWAGMAAAVGYLPDERRFLPGSPIVADTPSEIAAHWAPFRPDLGAESIRRIIDEAGLAVTADPAFLFPAAPDLSGLLAGLRARGYALGVATHDSEAGALSQIALAGVPQAFDFVAGYDSGHGLKPGPGMLLAFARSTGIAPGEVVMVGDSRHDLETARNAGAALAIGVLTGPAGRDDLAPFADHILPSIGELPGLLAALGL